MHGSALEAPKLLKYREDITDGLENAPRELTGLLKGENFGKKIIRVSPDATNR